MSLTIEQVELAKKAASVEELMALAKENGVDLSEEEAQENFNMLHAQGELADDELDSVAGGGCKSNDGLVYYDSWNEKCAYCGRKKCSPKLRGDYDGNPCVVYRCDDCGGFTVVSWSHGSD